MPEELLPPFRRRSPSPLPQRRSIDDGAASLDQELEETALGGRPPQAIVQNGEAHLQRRAGRRKRHADQPGDGVGLGGVQIPEDDWRTFEREAVALESLPRPPPQR
jgi:hypothetical protein